MDKSNRDFQLRLAIGLALLLSFINQSSSSFLNKVVLQRLFLAGSNSIDINIWENVGFERTATTTNVSPKASDSSTIFENGQYYTNKDSIMYMALVAQRSAVLSTVLHNFNHSHLIINFQSLIGKSKATESEPTKETTFPISSSSTIESTTPLTVTTIPEEISQVQVHLSNNNAIGETNAKITPNLGNNHVIQITLTNPAASKVGMEVNNVSQIKPLIVEVPTVVKAENGNISKRRKRELDSKEISQVHHILSVALSNATAQLKSTNTNNDNANSEPGVLGENLSSAPLATSAVLPEITVTPEITTLHEVGSTTSASAPIFDSDMSKDDDPNILQQVSKSSETKFYLKVNDEIVYDNSVGVYPKLNILGRTLWNETVNCNETEILYNVGPYSPHKDIKVTFVWDLAEVDTSDVLYLNSISLGTFEETTASMPIHSLKAQELISPPPLSTSITTVEHTTTKSTTEPGVAVPIQSQPVHSNITLFIVVKAHNSDSNDNEDNQHDHDHDFTTTVETLTSEKKNDKADSKKITSTSSPTNAIESDDEKNISTVVITSSKPAATMKIAKTTTIVTEKSIESQPLITISPLTTTDNGKLKILNRDPRAENSFSLPAMVVLIVVVTLIIIVTIGLVHRRYKEKQHRRPVC